MVFLVLLERRVEEEILDSLVWKDQLVKWVREDLRVLQALLVHLVKLVVLEIQDRQVHLEKWEHLEAWETEDHLDHKALKVSLALLVFLACLE